MNWWSWTVVIWFGLTLAVPTLWVAAALVFGGTADARHRGDRKGTTT